MPARPADLPPIVLCASDHDRLQKAAFGALLASPRLAGPLLEEVDRAQVVADGALGPDAVRLGSWVEFTDGVEGPLRGVRLVETPACKAAGHELSVLSTEGAALVGLRTGQTIVWPDRLGRDRVLTVVRAGPHPSG
jgi:regulator of nucleoside diphosphate kinase